MFPPPIEAWPLGPPTHISLDTLPSSGIFGDITPSTGSSNKLDRSTTRLDCVSRWSEDSDDVPPDGGLRAWLVVAGGFLNFAIAFGMMNSFGTYQPIYQEHLNAPSYKVSWIGSTQMFLTFLGGLVFGPAFDRFGARKIMAAGTLVCLCSYIATSFATTFPHFLLAQGVLFGIGNAMLFYPATGAISEWFTTKRGLALGLALSGASAGGMFWPLIITELFKIAPQAWVYRILAAISIPILILSCILTTERKENRSTYRSNADTLYFMRAAITEPKFLALCVALFFIYGGMLIPFFYIPLFAMEHGIPNAMANNLPAIGYGIGIIGRILSGWIADRLGRFNVLIAIASGTSLVTYTWAGTTSYSAMVASVIFFCVFSGGLIPLGSACVAQTTPDMKYIGLRISAKMTLCAFAALGGAPMSGLIKDHGGGWFGCYAFSASGTLLGAVILLGVRFWNQPRPFAVV